MSFVEYFELFSILHSHSANLNDYKTLLKYIKLKKEFNFSEHADIYLTNPLRKFTFHLYERWRKSNRTYETFIKKYELWLQTPFYFPKECLCPSSPSKKLDKPSTSTVLRKKQKNRSYKQKSFLDLSDKQKRRRTTSLVAQNTADELAFALKLKLEACGNTDGAVVLSYLMENPEKSSQLRAFCEGNRFEPQIYSKEKALALMLHLDLSRSKYEDLRDISNLQSIKQYPPYYQIRLAKKDCYPPKEAITISDVHASIKLQALLDLTVCRLFEACNIDKRFEKQNLKLISKWGFDGASCQSLYKQAFTNSSDDFDKPKDDSIFITCLVPLKLMNDSIVIWENVKPSSTRYCRPLKFDFVKENDEVIRNESQRMSNEIKALIPTSYKGISVEHELLFTMVDGKVCSTLAESSSMVCFICGVTPKNMNNFDLICQKEVRNVEYYKFGLSSLHAWIRCMEFLLHISYNLEIKKWSIRNPEEKLLKENRKKKVQEDFRNKLGLLIDVVKQGVGSTNDGNTARKFFEDPSITAKITGLDEEVIRKFAIILQAIASHRQCDPQKFDCFAKNLAKLVINKYGWYYMSSTVHKILFHGAEIIKHAILPIGQLSEEAIEARHKEFRRYRLQHTRKTNRKATNEDVLHHLLITSDPVISNLRCNVKKSKEKKLFREVWELFLEKEENSDKDNKCNDETDSFESD